MPDEDASRNLTLISKILMSLANGHTFGLKESYLQPANEFIIENMPLVKQYVDTIAVSINFRFDRVELTFLALHSLIH
jgi:hypothetical protein